MKTAMQTIIEKMNDAKENLPPISFHDEFLRGFNKAFQMAIFIAKKNGLEAEKEQIMEAYTKGVKDFARLEPERHGNERPTAEDYYQETYKLKQ